MSQNTPTSMARMAELARTLGFRVLDLGSNETDTRFADAERPSAGGARRIVDGGPPVAIFSAPKGVDAIAVVADPASQSEDLVTRGLLALEEASRDLAQLINVDNDLDDFARELSISYETMAAIFDLGNGLGTFVDAASFIPRCVDRARAMLGFRTARLRLDAPLDRFGLSRPLSPGGLIGEDVDADERTRLDRAIDERSNEFNRQVWHNPDGDPKRDIAAMPIELRDERIGWIAMTGFDPAESHTGDGITSLETKVIGYLAHVVASSLQVAQLNAEKDRSFLGVLRALTASLDAKDPYTLGHSERVSLLAGKLAVAHGLDPSEIRRVRLAGSLHDIGKIGVPDRVLLKPSRLDDEEFTLIKHHPAIGERILAPIPELTDVLPAVRHHHERWDGAGYPDKIDGERIPLSARLLAVADTFDAMSSNRSYRSARTREEVLSEIERVAGSQLDPTLANLFLTLDLSDFDRMHAAHLAASETHHRPAA